ncbi:DcaP family trimeric outer membrane transporter [Novosphingobium pituita]|uniref:Porin n=1 Tax=Novosphingobium pituita TaxID=3056842 RepID=A0ABQ6P2Z7_9SPHN|nr:DcaP family trimeric outer membrane transporter [Novosphingobium sp. IK01]GMM59628.1 hypothetical protein NUTIK01_04050 [Novosphingobium sp. IK01]
MILWYLRNTTALLTAAAMVVPTAGMAHPVHHRIHRTRRTRDTRDTHEAELEVRLQKLEDEVSALRGALKAARVEQAAASPVDVPAPMAAPVVTAQAATSRADTPALTRPSVSATRVAAAEQGAAIARAEAAAVTRVADADMQQDAEPRQASGAGAGNPRKLGFHSGNSSVTLSGYVKFLAGSGRYNGGNIETNSFGRDIYLPQTLPLYNPAAPASPTQVTDFNAKQTRFWVDAETKLGRHSLKAYIELDFQAAPGTPMASGQGTQRTTNAYDLAMRRAFIQFDRWTVGQDFTNFENVATLPESTDYIGGVDGLIFVRQPQIRYALPVLKNTRLYVAVENPETASSTTGHAQLIENGEDHAPDATARLEYTGGFGFLNLATIWRQLRVDNALSGANHIYDSRLGWGVSAQGKVFLGASHRSDVRFQATYGSGLGRYLGLNFSPDAVLNTGGKLSGVRNIALFGAAHIGLDKQWRLNFIGSWQKVDYAGDLDRSDLGIGMFNRQAWSAAANVFYSPVDKVDVGLEYRRGNREVVSGLDGHVDKFEFMAKYSF